MRVWKRSGVARHSPAVERKAASSLPSVSRTSTQEPKTPQASLGFLRRARITRGVELQRIAQEGKRFRTTHLEVRAIASPLVSPQGTRTRVGLIVPRFRQTAVLRNRLKRRLRELSRTRLLVTDVAADVVIRIRPDAYQATFASLTLDMERAITLLVRWRALLQDSSEEALDTTVRRDSSDT